MVCGPFFRALEARPTVFFLRVVVSEILMFTLYLEDFSPADESHVRPLKPPTNPVLGFAFELPLLHAHGQAASRTGYISSPQEKMGLPAHLQQATQVEDDRPTP